MASSLRHLDADGHDAPSWLSRGGLLAIGDHRAVMRRQKIVSWTDKPGLLADLQSPFTMTPLKAVREPGASSS